MLYNSTDKVIVEDYMFCDQVKHVRQLLKISQYKLAQTLGVSFATINRWENGSYNPSRLAKKAFEEFCNDKNIKFEVSV